MSKILVVDDEPDLEVLIRQKFRRRIRDGSVSFAFAQNGVQALVKLREEPDIDMILSDINMPEMDGLTLLGQLKNVAPMIKAVVVSAYGDMHNIRTAMNRGAFDFVTKPIDFDDLEVTIEKTLEHLNMIRNALASHDRLVALQQELDVAARMQQQILPGAGLAGEGYEIAAHMRPAREVGGDFYDFFRREDGKICIVIADVSGKGVPAALFMAVSQTLLRAKLLDNLSPGEALERVNDLLCPDNESAMFVTVFVGLFDPATGTLVHATAGHGAPYLIKAGGGVEPVEIKTGIALGVFGGMPFEERTVQLAPGDTLVAYTDGVNEANDPDHAEYGNDRLVETLGRHAADSPRELVAAIEADVDAFAGGAEQHDDITCLALRHVR